MPWDWATYHLLSDDDDGGPWSLANSRHWLSGSSYQYLYLVLSTSISNGAIMLQYVYITSLIPVPVLVHQYQYQFQCTTLTEGEFLLITIAMNLHLHASEYGGFAMLMITKMLLASASSHKTSCILKRWFLNRDWTALSPLLFVHSQAYRDITGVDQTDGWLLLHMNVQIQQ